MTKMRKFTLGLLLGLLVAFMSGRASHAQSTTFNIQVVPGTTSANCVVVLSATSYCFTGGGTIYVSVNGAAYAAYTGGASAGVLSFNGRTGAVVPVASDYPDAVTSVNGKTGAVVIAATTTSTTTLQ